MISKESRRNVILGPGVIENFWKDGSRDVIKITKENVKEFNF